MFRRQTAPDAAGRRFWYSKLGVNQRRASPAQRGDSDVGIDSRDGGADTRGMQGRRREHPPGHERTRSDQVRPAAALPGGTCLGPGQAVQPAAVLSIVLARYAGMLDWLGNGWKHKMPSSLRSMRL